MKKLAKISAFALAGFLLFGFTSIIRDANFEGVIKYNIKIDSDNPQAVQMMQGSSMTMYIKGDMSRTEVNMGMYKAITIANRKEPDSAVSLVDFMGNKYELKTDAKEKKEAEDNKPEIKYLSGTKTIAGYDCKEAQIVLTDKKTNKQYTTDVYYTDQLSFGDYNSEFKSMNGLKGFPMSFSMQQSGMTMNMTVTTVDKQSVSDDLFKIPSGYKVMTREEMQQDMMSHSGGGGN